MTIPAVRVGASKDSIGPVQYMIQKDASNVNFEITITSTSRTITMKTKYVYNTVIETMMFYSLGLQIHDSTSAARPVGSNDIFYHHYSTGLSRSRPGINCIEIIYNNTYDPTELVVQLALRLPLTGCHWLEGRRLLS